MCCYGQFIKLFISTESKPYVKAFEPADLNSDLK